MMRTVNDVVRESRNRNVELSVIVRQVREKSIALADGETEDVTNPVTGEITQRERWIWCPKSQVQRPAPAAKPGDVESVIVPEWLAKDRGLI
jgi:hypothetical protein